MRVCMLLRNTFTRDARVLREARSLAAAGHEVTVVALRAGDLPRREERDGFVVLRPVDAGPLAGPTISRTLETGSRWRLPRVPAAVWLRDRMLASRLTRAARSIQADVYHAHDLNTLEPAVAAARIHEARIVYDAHELWPDLTGLGRGERARWRRAEHRLIHEADLVIVPSQSRGEELVRRYGIAMPAVVMNCPPAPNEPPDPGASRLAALRRRGETLVVYAGGFSPNRGLENVVRSIDLVEGLRLVMLGWGPLEGALRRLASEKVLFEAPVEPDAVVPTLAGAHIGLVSYLPIGRNNELAAPNKLFEYLHAGLAVAGSDLPDIRRIVEEHSIGELFDASSPDSIAQALSRMVPLIDQLRSAAAAVRSNYSWETAEKVLLEAYSSLATIPSLE